jgi:hypothetical protein
MRLKLIEFLAIKHLRGVYTAAWEVCETALDGVG